MEAATLYAIGQEKGAQTLSLFVISDSITDKAWVPHIKELSVRNNLHKLADWALKFCRNEIESSEKAMKKNIQIIYINGPSSSGKTTLAQALQQEFDVPFLHIGIDRVIGMMPDKLNDWEGGPAPLGFSWKPAVDETGAPVHEIQTGPFGKKMSQTLKEFVLTLVRMGHYVIVDDVAFGKCDVDAWREALKDYNVLWVGVNVPLDVLEAREKERGNRMHGSARAQYFKVHKDVVYDLEFDTSKEPLEAIVTVIKQSLGL